jgi:hypothetical protein
MPTVKVKAKKAPHSAVKIRGFFHVQIREQDGRIVGDSGWVPNQVVNLGKFQYLITPLTGGASKFISRMGLGTGTAPAAADTSLQGELSHQTNAASGTRNRPTVTPTVLAGSTQVQFVGSFLSANLFATTTANIQNVMVINDTTAGGTIFAGNTFASSLLNTNQDVLVTYQINFA